MDITSSEQPPVHSHERYIESLLRPTLSETRRISEIQLRKEAEIDGKYKQPFSEHAAATAIQKAYRGHRERRQLEGLTLDPSSRWMEVIRELRYRAAILPHGPLERPQLSPDGRPRSSSEIAQAKWRRIGYVAEHASAGERSPPTTAGTSQTHQQSPGAEPEESMLMDIRYFLEMVDHKHRYGSNLLVFHEEWLRSQSERNFFHWLDHGEGRHLDLPGCTREKLDRERIRYLSKDQRRDYLVEVDEVGRLRWAKTGDLITTSTSEFKDSMTGIVRRSDEDALSFGDAEVRQQVSADTHLFDGIMSSSTASQPRPVTPDDTDGSRGSFDSPRPATPLHDDKPKKRLKRIVASPATILNKLLRATVKPGTWIYVADTVGRLYVGIKSSGAFQHASFLSGARISSAGLIGIESGQLTYLSPLSGHYRPTTKSFRRFIGSLKSQGVDLSHLRVSHAYEILLGIEYYGRTRKGLKSLHTPKKEHRVGSPAPDRKLHDAINTSATDLVEENWKRGRRSTLTKMMDGLRVRRKSGEPR